MQMKCLIDVFDASVSMDMKSGGGATSQETNATTNRCKNAKQFGWSWLKIQSSRWVSFKREDELMNKSHEWNVMHPANTAELVWSFVIGILDMVLPWELMLETWTSSVKQVQQFQACKDADVLGQLFSFFLFHKRLLQPANRVIGIGVRTQHEEQWD